MVPGAAPLRLMVRCQWGSWRGMLHRLARTSRTSSNTPRQHYSCQHHYSTACAFATLEALLGLHMSACARLHARSPGTLKAAHTGPCTQLLLTGVKFRVLVSEFAWGSTLNARPYWAGRRLMVSSSSLNRCVASSRCPSKGTQYSSTYSYEVERQARHVALRMWRCGRLLPTHREVQLLGCKRPHGRWDAPAGDEAHRC